MGVRAGFLTRVEAGRLEFRRVSIARSIAGVIILVLAWGLFHIAPDPGARASSGTTISAWISYPAALAAAAAGLALLVYRSGITFDRARDDIHTWWGLPKPVRTQRSALSNYREVAVQREVRTTHTNNGSSRTIVFAVRLNAPGDADALEIAAPKDAMAARGLGETIARACGLPLRSVMSSAGSHTLRQPEELDWSLRQQIEARGQSPDEPVEPPRSRLVVSPDGNRRVVDLPSIGLLRGGLGISLLALPGAFMFVGFALSALDDAPPIFVATFCMFAALPFLIGLWAGLTRGLRTEQLRVDAGELSVERRSPLGTRKTTVPSMLIEEASWSPSAPSILGSLVASGGVTLVTDERLIEFGRGASDAEREYLVQLIEHAVCLGTAPPSTPTTARL